MFPQQFQNLEELAKSNHGRFVNPGSPQPGWLFKVAQRQEYEALLKADRNAAQAAPEADGASRPGLFRRLLPLRNRA